MTLGLIAIADKSLLDAFWAANVPQRLWQLLRSLAAAESTTVAEILRQRTLAALTSLVSSAATLSYDQLLVLEPADASMLLRTLAACVDRGEYKSTSGKCGLVAKLIGASTTARDTMWSVDLFGTLARSPPCLFKSAPLAVAAVGARCRLNILEIAEARSAPEHADIRAMLSDCIDV